MISPSLNHVFVIVHGVLWSSKEHLAYVPVPLSRVGLGHEAANVRSVVDLGFSVHVTYTSHCVNALIEGNEVAMMLVTIKGHLKVTVYQAESISSNHLTVLIYLSIRLSIRLSFFLCRRQCP